MDVICLQKRNLKQRHATEKDLLNHFLERQRLNHWLAAYLVLGLSLPVHTVGSILSWIPTGLNDPRSILYFFNQLKSLYTHYQSAYPAIESYSTHLFRYETGVLLVFDSRIMMFVYFTSDGANHIEFATPFPFPIPEQSIPFITWSELYHQIAPLLHKILEHISQ